MAFYCFSLLSSVSSRKSVKNKESETEKKVKCVSDNGIWFNICANTWFIQCEYKPDKTIVVFW